MGPSFPVRTSPANSCAPIWLVRLPLATAGLKPGGKRSSATMRLLSSGEAEAGAAYRARSSRAADKKAVRYAWPVRTGRPVPGGNGEAAERRGAARRSRLVNAVTYKPVLHGEARNFADIMQIKLFHKAGAVGVDGLDRQVQLGGDVFVAVALGNEFEHHFFLWRQGVGFRGGFGVAVHV